MHPNLNHPQPNAADKVALAAIATRIIQTCPSLQDTAHEVAADLLKKYGITGVDPDRVYFHRFEEAQSSVKAFTGWEHVNTTPTSSMTLTQLVIHRFRAADQDNADLLDVYAGFYTAGPTPGTFDERNEVRLHGHEVLKDFWSIDFSSLYNERLTAFWDKSGSDFRTLTKCNFLISALRARDRRQLSEEDFQFVTETAMGPITWPVSLQLLQTPHPGNDCVRTLDVAGYVATNALRFIAPTGRQIVYLPGEADAFQTLQTTTDMHFWMLQRMNKEQTRQVFMTHFGQADRQTIAENITDLMNRLVSTWGQYDHHLINQQNRIIHGDVFSWLRDSTKTAMFAEATLSLTSNGDLRKKLWAGYLSAGVKIFGPMAVVGWPIALPVIGASIANMGLNIDQAVNGRTAEERKAGILGAVLSGIDILFNVLLLKGPGSLEAFGPDIEAAEAKEMSDLKAATPGPTQVDASVETPARPESPAQVPPTIKGDVALGDDILVREPGEIRPGIQRPTPPAHWQANELLEGATPGSEAGKFQGIYRLNANPSAAIMLNDTAYYVRYEADINGGGHWSIIDPAHPESFSSSIPVRLNAQGEWETMPRGGLRGGGKTLPTQNAGSAARPGRDTTPLPASPYDMPPSLKPALKNGAAGTDTDSLRDAYDSLRESDPFRDFKAIRKRLYQDALRFYRELDLPRRPPIPTLSPDAGAEETVEKLLEHARGLVLGETHSDVGAKQWLIENMELLARKNVKTLYMEHVLTDFHQAALDSYLHTGVMPKELEHYLKVLDIGQMTDPLERYTFLEVVKAAAKQRIHVQAIDCMASYRLNGMTHIAGEEDFVDENARQKLMNFFARTIIRTDQAARGAHKWVALVGNSHSNTFEGVAGISELEEAIGIRVEDVAEGASGGIEVDPGRVMTTGDTLQGRSALVKGDLRLQVETPWSAQTMDEFEKLLPRYGMYSLKQQPRMIFLVHRSRSQELVRTLIETDGERFYIERPNWPSVSGKRYGSIKALLQALDDMGLTLAGWSKPL